jgi:hypothetical protein
MYSLQHSTFELYRLNSNRLNLTFHTLWSAMYVVRHKLWYIDQNFDNALDLKIYASIRSGDWWIKIIVGMMSSIETPKDSVKLWSSTIFSNSTFQIKYSGTEPKAMRWETENYQGFRTYVTNYKEQSHYWEDECHSVGQEIPRASIEPNISFLY